MSSLQNRSPEFFADGNEPPLPPVELRRLVCPNDEFFRVTPGVAPFPQVPERLYESVFDFGCGCGRITRQLLCMTPKPARYVGIDIHRGMIAWCQKNLTRYDPSFRFFHHDVWNLGLGPDNTRQLTAPFPVGRGEFTLFIAHSVFTHIYKEQTEFYLGEVARILADNGVARTTWFFFDKRTFPMMFDFQVCLYVNESDPTNAVIYDWRWFLKTIRRVGLRVKAVVPPVTRGEQWEVFLEKRLAADTDDFPTGAEVLNQMCGTGFMPPADTVRSNAADTSPATEVTPGSPTEEVVETHRLRFTGSMSEDEFQRKCAEVDSWYHSFCFDNGYEIHGDYKIGSNIADYGLPDSMEGMRVLDLGSGAGWFSFYFEQLGAEVVAVDARGYNDFDVYGRFEYPPTDRPPDRLNEDGTPVYYSSVNKGFWVMREILGSRVQFRNARVYEICPELFGGRGFDLVFLGALLCHLRDPIGALMAARRVCNGTVIAYTPVVLGEPESDTMPRQYLPWTEDDKISWWLPNEACFRHWFLAAGFTAVDISRVVKLRCDVSRIENGRAVNGDQTLRVGRASVR
jgi:SAM-dependent methyltransferase